jgi:hypothetical protein
MKKNRLLFFAEDDGAGGSGGSGGSGATTLIAGDAGAGGAGGAGSGQLPAAGAPAPYFGADGNFVEGWADKLPDGFITAEDLPAFKAHASKYKNPLDAIKSDFHKEKMLGRKAQAVVIPGEKSAPEEVAAFRKALGVPETPDGYKLKPESLPDGITWSDDLAKPFAEIAHKHNITPAAMADLVKVNLEQQQAMFQVASETAVANDQAELDKGMQTLKETWKNDTEKNLGFVSRVAKSIGLDPSTPGLRDPNVIIALQRAGAMLSEDKLISGDVATTMQPGKVRANEIMTNPADPMFADYAGKNGKDRQTAAAKLVADLLKNG